VAERIEVETVPDALVGQRIDRIVALLADVARSRAANLIAEGKVTIDGIAVDKPSQNVSAGSSLTIDVDRVAARLAPEPSIEVPTVYVDRDVIVVDKPAGLVVHPGSGVGHGTMVHGLLARFPELVAVGPADRPGIVHRLDRGTSGLLMVARNERARSALSDQLERRTVERRYCALVLGHLDAEAGVIDAPLGRSPRSATRRAIVADGRPARTHYEVIDRFGGTGSGATPPLTLLSCRLETGRTHQIRAHLSAIGHSVAGDDAYDGAIDGDLVAGLARPFLHAEVLGFDHPTTGDRLRFTSELPADLRAALDRVG